MEIERSNAYGNDFGFTLANECIPYAKVKITGDLEVDQADPGDISIGTVMILPDSFPGKANIRTKHSLMLRVLAEGAVTAGDRVKLGTNDTDGNQRYAAFVPGTDDISLVVGHCVKGGTDAEIFILTD